MTLFWFMLGTALIFTISRYFESNKLFWLLYLSFVMGFAGTKMYIDATADGQQNNVSSVQVSPTQAPTSSISMPHNTAYVDPKAIIVVTAQKSVSQDYPVLSKADVVLHKVLGRTRDQPTSSNDIPRKLQIPIEFFDTS